MKYIAHLGRNKELAIAELLPILGSESLRKFQGEFLLIDTERYLNQEFIDRLGGTIAIYAIHSTFRNEINQADLIDAMTEDLRTQERKVNISFESRAFDFKTNREILKKVKKNLKDLSISCRFIEKPSTASFIGGGFLRGKVAAYKVFDFEGISYFGKMMSLQNINKYSLRDYKKPYRDAKLGMHPPKLSQIMLNLAGKFKTVYDPFCGTGTILLEAALQFKSIKGSDIKPENVFGSIRNIEWMQEKFDLNGLAYDVFQGDARNISKDSMIGVDIVVSEGYLGEPKKGNEPQTKLLAEMQELENLYINFLTSLSKASSQPLAVVLNFPVYVSGRQKIFFKKIVDKVKTLGYSVSALLPEQENLGLAEKQTLVYERPGQKVLREVIRFDYIPG